LVAVEVLDSGPSVENDHAFSGTNFASGTERLESSKAGSSFGRNEETFA
jgi:hypothetical protein